MKVWIEFSNASLPTKKNKSWFIAILPVLELRCIDDDIDNLFHKGSHDTFYVLDFGWLFWFWQLFIAEVSQ